PPMRNTLGVRSLLAYSIVLAAAACSGGDTGTPSPDAPGGGGGGWQPLVTKGWTLAPGAENTSDLQLDTIDTDLVIGGMRPLAPVGTHHTLLFRGANSTNIIYASGVGTNEMMFPPHTAMKISAGTLIG